MVPRIRGIVKNLFEFSFENPKELSTPPRTLYSEAMIRSMAGGKPLSVPPLPAPLAGAFDADVARVVLQLRSAFTGVFAALPRPIRGGTDLQRELGLPSTLSWQLHGFVNSTDPIAAANQIPGRQATRRALAAAEAKGVSRAALDRAAAAFDEFEACVERHAGDRASFASMVSSMVAGESSSVDLDARREAFRATSHIYGLQAGVSVNAYILHPGDTPGWYDFVFLNGSVGLRVMRPFDKLFIGRHGHEPDHPRPDQATSQPIVPPRPEFDGAPVLEEFSTRPLPAFKSEIATKTHREIYISGPPVGRTGELTYFVAERWPAAAPRDEKLEFNATLLHPTAALLHDVLLAPSVTDRTPSPRTGVFGGALNELRRKLRETDRLNIQAQSNFAGVGVESLQTPLVPRYVEMLRFVCQKLGWDADAFDTYRCQVEYPVLHSLLDVSFPPAGKPIAGP
jgi:hypothetical protein